MSERWGVLKFWIMLGLVLAGGVLSFWLISMAGQNTIDNDKKRERVLWD